jgi:hypothetical protein
LTILENKSSYLILSPQGVQDGVKYRKLPNSELVVSEVCLGTMNFGEQLNEEQATNILDAAFGEYGINFLVSLSLNTLPSMNLIINYFPLFRTQRSHILPQHAQAQQEHPRESSVTG